MNREKLQQKLAQGWNTWNTRSVLSHVLLPEGLAINLVIKNYQTGQVIRESLIGRFGENEEQIHPGPRSYNGQYTELTWKQHGLELFIQSAANDTDQYLLITPRHQVLRAPALLIEVAMLWNRPGSITKKSHVIEALLGNRSIEISTDGSALEEYNTGAQTPYLSVSLDRPVAVWTGKKPTQPFEQIMANAKSKLIQTQSGDDKLIELMSAMRTSMAWDTIYEPEHKQVCSPVSRLWNINWGGYVLFCWDTYFAAMMTMYDNPDLSAANALAITAEKTENGFVPNFGAANNYKSRDRSQPPVGSLAVHEIYRHQRQTWLIKALFDDLLVWNRWWEAHRMTDDHVLCWGSDPYEPVSGTHWEQQSVHDTAGAALESGLDNSPMYDHVPFDDDKNIMLLADVGLTGLYIMDCEYLANLADVIGRPEADELRQRADSVKQGLETLWDDETGIYQNKRIDTGEFYRRLSPTNFYALFSDKVSPDKAQRMINEHFYNPDEFWGEYIMPSISRDDPAYPDQDYWRGRIWAPINYLAYLAMRKHNLTKATKDFADRSVALFMQEWKAHGHVHENYDGDTGWGCGVKNSDKFYHWGALLCLTALTEAGEIQGPESPL